MKQLESRRVLIVFDGDNFDRSSIQYGYNLSRYDVLEMIQEVTARSLEPCRTIVGRVFFTTAGRVAPGQKQSLTVDYDAHHGIENRCYPQVQDHYYDGRFWIPFIRGYRDGVVQDYILQQRDRYDELVLISGDRDFFNFADDRARYDGKVVTVMSFAAATNPYAVTSTLRLAQHRYLDDIFDISVVA